jgi:hypothetical protein
LNINEIFDDKCKYTNCLDERFDRLKCMVEINSKTIMLNENHMYMDEITKMMKYFNELLDDNWK